MSSFIRRQNADRGTKPCARVDQSELYGLNLMSILRDDENAAVIARRIDGRQKETNLLRVISLSCTDDFFSIAKRNLQTSTGATHIFGGGLLTVGITGEIFYKEDSLDVFQFNFDSSLLGRVLPGKEVKGLL